MLSDGLVIFDRVGPAAVVVLREITQKTTTKSGFVNKYEAIVMQRNVVLTPVATVSARKH